VDAVHHPAHSAGVEEEHRPTAVPQRLFPSGGWPSRWLSRAGRA
jgi:hypothetical protein